MTFNTSKSIRHQACSTASARRRRAPRGSASVICTMLLALAACGEQGQRAADSILGSSTQALTNARNVARDAGVVVRAQSTFPGYAASKVIDGDTNPTVGPEYGWANAHQSAADGRLPQWFEVDLGAARVIDRIVLHTSRNFEIKDYDIQVWTGDAWTPLLSQRDNRQAVVEHAFPELETSKVRVLGLRGPDTQPVYVRINELEIYGADAPTVSPVVIEPLEEGEGWRRVEVSGIEDEAGTPIAEQLTIIEPQADLQGAPLPASIIQAMGGEGSADTHILSDWVLDEIQVAEAQGTLTPRLMEIAEAEDESGTASRSAAARRVTCPNQEVVQVKTVSKKAGYQKKKDLARGLTGNIDVSGDITAAATVEVRMTKTYVKVLRWCIPYGTRLNSVQIQGQLTVNEGARVEGSLEYSDRWEERIAEPYVGSFTFMAGPVPVVVVLSLPITAGLDLSARVRAGVTYTSSQAGQGSFNLACSAAGCSGSGSWNLRGQPLSDLVDADLSGDVHVNPWIEGAVKAALYHENLVYVQGGLRPTLEGHLWGYLGSNCGDVDQDGSNENVRALMGDLNGTIYVTGKMSAFSQAPRSWNDLWHHTLHLGYANFLDDWSAAQPMIQGPASTSSNTATPYGVRMRPCWPFTGTVDYEIANGQGQVQYSTGAPATPTMVPLSWTSPGRFQLSARALGDDDGRDFEGVTTRSIDVQSSPERNLALDPGVSAAAQSTFGGYSARRVIDGSTSTAVGGDFSWTNAHTTPGIVNGRLPQWLDINLGSNRQLERIRVYTTAEYPIRDYDIQSWSGSAWVTIGSARGNTAAVVEHDVSANASRVRIVSLRGPDRQAFYARLNEVEIYGY